MRISAFFEPLAIKLLSGALLVSFIAFGALAWRADAISADRDEARKTADQAELKLEVSNASIADLEESLAVFVGAGKASRVAQLASIEAQADKSAAMRAQAESIREMARSFEPEDPCDCSTPGFVMEGR